MHRQLIGHKFDHFTGKDAEGIRLEIRLYMLKPEYVTSDSTMRTRSNNYEMRSCCF